MILVLTGKMLRTGDLGLMSIRVGGDGTVSGSDETCGASIFGVAGQGAMRSRSRSGTLQIHDISTRIASTSRPFPTLNALLPTTLVTNDKPTPKIAMKAVAGPAASDRHHFRPLA